MHSNTLVDLEHVEAGAPSIAELCDMAALGLAPMLDPDRKIFCHIYGRTAGGMQRHGLSPRYTMMTLLGLHRYERSGHTSPVPIGRVLDALLADLSWVDGAGDLGLLLWTLAEIAPERLPRSYAQLNAAAALQTFADGRQGRTMEVAWYLTGLVTSVLAGFDSLPGISEQVTAARRILEQNCGTSGIFGHLGESSALAGKVRRAIGSFADQVYPTIAFARLAQAYRDEAARTIAVRNAEIMCRLQGPLGEWSWHYDSVTGRVVNRYPVYSVHQHAMAPMMLFAAADVSGSDFSDSIYRGLAWIAGNNELRRNFVEPSLGLVWRCIYLRPLDSYTDAALRFLRLRSGAADVRLKVRYECRPYELGWLLYAFAGR
ncbi:MAG: hypothetical protein WA294_18880 [Acidobacteriaceae bacterium]